MRFARDPEREPERTETEVVDQDGRPVTTVTVESEKPKERFIEIEVCSPKQPAKMLTVPIVYEEPSSPKMARSRSARR